jgi:HTH-type transcriptional regulator/antitoxin MqsA
MECPNCEGVMMIEKVKSIPFTYKGNTTVIDNVSGEECPNCGEYILSREESKRIDIPLKAFVQEINAKTSDPKFIRDVRKKLNLDQQEAGKLFGGGVNAFSRYETGKTVPPQSLIQLLRLLDRHPDLLAEFTPA